MAGNQQPPGQGPGNPGNPNPPGQAKKQKYEYMVYDTQPYARDDPALITKLNEQGAEGWWLVSTDEKCLYFVRELQDQ